MTLNNKLMFQEQQKNILYHSMNTGNWGNVANTIEKIQIKDIQQKKNHIAYRILTVLSRTNKTKHANSSRRYSDFEKLHIYFKFIFSKSKIIILPKLPSKHGIQDMIDIWEESKAEFFHERKEDLEIYLNLLMENQAIKDDPIFQQFLEEGPTDKLEEEITKAKISIPSSAPEKAYNVIKNTFNSVKSIFDNFNASVVEVEQGLKSKIDKIEKTKATMFELLSLQMQRAKCLKVKQKQLSALKNNQNNSIVQGLALTLKQKILASIGYSQSQNSNCLPCIQKLYNYIQMKFKQQKNYSDKMQEMKKDLKTMIARCDSILEIYEEIISDKQHLENIPKRLAELGQLIHIQFYMKEGVKVLQQYTHYYKLINKLPNNNMLSRVNEEDDEEDF